MYEPCPRCGVVPVSGEVWCRQCGFNIDPAAMARLAEIRQQIAHLNGEWQTITSQLAASTPQPAPPQPAAAPSFMVTPQPSTNNQFPESSSRSVQNILLWLGGALCLIAAILFTAVAWSRLGLGGRAVIMVAVTAAIGAAGYATFRRQLTATGEVLTTLAFTFAVIDVGAAYALDFAGLKDFDASTYWALALGCIALAACAYRAIVPMKTTSYIAIALGQLPVFLFFEDSLFTSPLVWATALAVQTMLLLMVGSRLAKVDGLQDLSMVADVCAVATWVAAFMSTIGSSFDGDVRFALVIAGYAVVAGSAFQCAVIKRDSGWLEASFTAGVLAIAAAMITCSTHLFDDRLIFVGFAVSALALMVLAVGTARLFPSGTAVIAGVMALLGLAGAIPETLISLFSALTIDVERWSLGSNEPIFALLEIDDISWSNVVFIIFAITVATSLVAMLLSEERSTLLGCIAVIVALALDVLPLSLDFTYGWLVVYLTLFGSVVLLGALPIGVRWVRRLLQVTGVVFVLQALAWSLASEAATLIVFAVVGVVALLIALADSVLRPLASGVAAAMTLLWLAAIGESLAWSHEATAFAVVVAAWLMVGVSDAFVKRLPALWPVTTLGAIAVVFGGLFLFTDVFWLSAGLLATALATETMALRSERQWMAWLSGATLVVFVWLRLGEANIVVPEAYAAPLVVYFFAAGRALRRRNPEQSSWVTLLPGLLCMFVPSAVVLDSESALRPALFGAAALAVLLYGAKRRLQAPLVLGSVALLVDAVVQFGPYWHYVQRWLVIGAIGSLLVFMGATYERRRRDLQVLKVRYEALK